MIRLIRFAFGRWFIHLGLWVMPKGRVKKELWTLLDLWASKVMYEVERDDGQNLKT